MTALTPEAVAASLTAAQVAEIRHARATATSREWGAAKYARKFGVNRTTVERAARGVSWKVNIRIAELEAAIQRLLTVFDQQKMTTAERIIVGISDAGLRTEGNAAIEALRSLLQADPRP